jgi:hypothetical protein
MSIAPKCTCGISMDGNCISGIKECAQFMMAKRFHPETPEEMEKKYPIGIEPNNSKHQDIIFKVCKAHGIKSLELTTKHIALMSDCISEYIAQQATTGPVWVKASDRLPGLKTAVKWRQGEIEMKVKAVWYMVLDTNSEYLSNCEWLDEQKQ